MKVKKYRLTLMISIILLFSILTTPSTGMDVSSSSQNILYVGGSGPQNYTMIQDALDTADPGDTIFVYNGTYYENIAVIKNVNLIGENKNNTIIDGMRRGSVIYLIGIGVYITGFTLQNSSREKYTHSGIEIYSGENHIENNIIKNNRVGVHVLFAKGLIPNGSSIFDNNIIVDNERDAFCVHSSNNIFIRNHLENNGGGVFHQQFARNNTVDENNFINNNYSSGHFRALFNTWDANYWDDWIGLEYPILKFLPKMIPKYWPKNRTAFIKLPWPSFDFNPQSEPYEII